MRHFLKFHLKFRVLLVLSMGVFPANGISTNSTTASTTGFSSTPSRPTDSIIKSTAGFSSTPGNISGSTTDSSTDSSTPSSPTDSIIKSTAGFSSTPGKISGSITDSSTDSSTPSSPAGFSTDYFTGYLTKSTLFSPSTTEKRTTTTELFDPCSPNPCLNGGTCDAISTNEYSCTCRYGFVDVNCKELDYCNFTLNGTRGDDYCNNNNAICISDNKTESFICSCVEDLDYFDYNENSCKGIPECLYNDICKQHEICNTTTGECRCKEEYQHNDTNSCVAKDFCAENCKGLNTVCTRGPEDNPKNIDCKCVTNYAKNKNGDCEATFCESGNHNCSKNEQCKKNSTLSSGYSCVCEKPFTVTNQSCGLQNEGECTNSNLNCGKGGQCKQVENKEWCICNKGYILHNNTCVEYCKSSSWLNNPLRQVCPDEQCEEIADGSIKCKCDGIWEQDGFGCQLKPLCSPGKTGYIACTKQNAECELNESATEGYSCRCRFGTMKDESGKCEDVCAFTENLETCERDFADCVTGENGEASCECKPSFVKSEDGSRCKLAGAAYIFHMTLKNRYNALSAAPPGVYFTESFNRKQLLEDIKSTMEVQYGDNFEDAVISDVKLVGGELYSSFSLQFTKEEMSINKITSDNVCRSQNKNDSYCIIPPSLVVNKEKLKETKIEPINQCSSPRRICPIHTDCVKHNENIEFSCTCKKHFKMIYGFSIGKKGRVEYCEDINECDSPNACPKFATCVNTIGSYSCPCDEGYKLKSNNDDPKKTDCIGVCSDNPCGKNGQCVPTNSDKFYCKCDKGYAGFRCTERDTFLSAAMKNTVVVGAVLGSALLLLIIGTTLVIYRLKRRKRISGKRNEIS